jgi:hypothetical protein
MVYSIRFYNSAGELVTIMNILSKDDASASDVFDKIKREYAMELWQGNRLIARAEVERQRA